MCIGVNCCVERWPVRKPWSESQCSFWCVYIDAHTHILKIDAYSLAASWYFYTVCSQHTCTNRFSPIWTLNNSRAVCMNVWVKLLPQKRHQKKKSGALKLNPLCSFGIILLFYLVLKSVGVVVGIRWTPVFGAALIKQRMLWKPFWFHIFPSTPSDPNCAPKPASSSIVAANLNIANKSNMEKNGTCYENVLTTRSLCPGASVRSNGSKSSSCCEVAIESARITQVGDENLHWLQIKIWLADETMSQNFHWYSVKDLKNVDVKTEFVP